MDHEPKDLRLARRAYEAFHDERPLVWFDQLSHAYQMRWVHAARAVLSEGKHPSDDKLEEARTIVEAAPRKGKRMDYKAMTPEEAKRVRMMMHRLATHNRTK